MAKLKAKNYFLRRILLIVFIVALIGVIGFIAYKKIMNSESLYYILEDNNLYKDTIIKDYSDYIFFTDEYEIKKDLNEKDFKNNYYIASFQEYDSCQERKVRKIKDIDINDKITITYKLFNKCGWCKSRTMLFLIKIDKLEKDNYEIEYKYESDKKLNCNVS